jgi:hypothetical protein
LRRFLQRTCFGCHLHFLAQVGDLQGHDRSGPSDRQGDCPLQFRANISPSNPMSTAFSAWYPNCDKSSREDENCVTSRERDPAVIDDSEPVCGRQVAR